MGLMARPLVGTAITRSLTTIPPKPVDPAREVCSLTRWPEITSLGGMLRCIDWAGSCVFSLSGAVAAASCGLDLLGTTLVGGIVGLGGGTIRDVFILSRAPFWVEETEYLWMCFASAAVTFFAWPLVTKDRDPTGPKLIDHPVLFWMDTVSLAAFAVIGVQCSIRCGMPFFINMLAGLISCTGGGIIRDILRREPVRILHSHAEIYATTALGGTGTYLAARALGLPIPARVITSMFTLIAMRVWATDGAGVRLPTWNLDERKRL